MKKRFSLGRVFDWGLSITFDTKQDIDCYDDFGATATLRNCWSATETVVCHNKYIHVDFLCRRLVEIKATQLKMRKK